MLASLGLQQLGVLPLTSMITHTRQWFSGYERVLTFNMRWPRQASVRLPNAFHVRGDHEGVQDFYTDQRGTCEKDRNSNVCIKDSIGTLLQHILDRMDTRLSASIIEMVLGIPQGTTYIFDISKRSISWWFWILAIPLMDLYNYTCLMDGSCHQQAMRVRVDSFGVTKVIYASPQGIHRQAAFDFQ
ncbi:hypothetical protein O0I10_006628 [Lichtheimia ornata]|uniref:Uncharacterized protein n=1 Tax=Lichtheimia ornata TaxID=688661 RepID=A0AAD7V1F9_9FUNG|nr:uncharacterized protein O0I10_006628 [Lichtheimia ornata]KAJ8657564.1 hypothetical protein O0I10_006628 [Lichtheimia ornata]